MIKTKDITPQVYYKNSRDFQVVGRVLEIMYNYILMNIDILLNNTINDNTNLVMVDLFLLTVGFKQTHNYTSVDLLKLVQVFKTIVKIKGTKSALYDCVYLLLKSQNIAERFEIKINTLTRSIRKRGKDLNAMYTIDLFLPSNLRDTILLHDLFDYILPAGFLINIYNTSGVLQDKVDTYANYSKAQIWQGKTSNKLFSQLTNDTTTKDGNINFGLVSGDLNVSSDGNDITPKTQVEGNEGE